MGGTPTHLRIVAVTRDTAAAPGESSVYHCGDGSRWVDLSAPRDLLHQPLIATNYGTRRGLEIEKHI